MPSLQCTATSQGALLEAPRTTSDWWRTATTVKTATTEDDSARRRLLDLPARSPRCTSTTANWLSRALPVLPDCHSFPPILADLREVVLDVCERERERERDPSTALWLKQVRKREKAIQEQSTALLDVQWEEGSRRSLPCGSTATISSLLFSRNVNSTKTHQQPPVRAKKNWALSKTGLDVCLCEGITWKIPIESYCVCVSVPGDRPVDR